MAHKRKSSVRASAKFCSSLKLIGTYHDCNFIFENLVCITPRCNLFRRLASLNFVRLLILPISETLRSFVRSIDRLGRSSVRNHDRFRSCRRAASNYHLICNFEIIYISLLTPLFGGDWRVKIKQQTLEYVI